MWTSSNQFRFFSNFAAMLRAGFASAVCRRLTIDSLVALAIVIARITRLLKLSLFFLLSGARAARLAGPCVATYSHSVEASPAKALQAAFMRFAWRLLVARARHRVGSRRSAALAACNTSTVDAYKLQRPPPSGSCSIEVIRGSLE